MFLAVTFLIFVSQKAITYRWNRNLLTNHIMIENHRFDEGKCDKNSKNRKITKSYPFF